MKDRKGKTGKNRMSKALKGLVEKARRLIAALPAGQREDMARALSGDAEAHSRLSKKIGDAVEGIRKMMDESESAKTAIEEALASTGAAYLEKEDLTARMHDVLLDAARRLEGKQREDMARALRDGDCEGMDADNAQFFALACFFAVASGDTARRLADAFAIPLDALLRTAAKQGGVERLEIRDTRQLLLPGFEEPAVNAVPMTRGLYGQMARFALSKVAQKVPFIEKGKKYILQDVIPARKGKGGVNVGIMLDFSQDWHISGRLTLFDRIVEDAVGNLMDDRARDNGVLCTTAETVFRQIAGLDARKKVSRGSLDRVNESLQRLAHCWCVLECDGIPVKAGVRIPKDWEKFIDEKSRLKGRKRNVMEAECLVIETGNGKTVDGWIIKSEPLIYTYSKLCGQIATVDRKILSAGAVSNTVEIVQLRLFLLQQIERIRAGHGDRVLYDTVFEKTGDKAAMEKTKAGSVARSRRLKQIRAILDGFKAEGHIAGWEEYGRGNKAGVVLAVPRRGNTGGARQ